MRSCALSCAVVRSCALLCAVVRSCAQLCAVVRSRAQLLLESTCIATDNACKLVINLIFNTIIYRIYIQYGYL